MGVSRLPDDRRHVEQIRKLRLQSQRRRMRRKRLREMRRKRMGKGMKPKCEHCGLEISGTVQSDSDHEALCADCDERLSGEPPEQNDVQRFDDKEGAYGEGWRGWR